MSNKGIKKKAQMDHVEDAPDLTDDDNKNIYDINSTEDSEDDSCMEVHGDEEWVKDYRDIVWSAEQVIITPDVGNHMNEEEDMTYRVVISHDGWVVLPDGRQWSRLEHGSKRGCHRPKFGHGQHQEGRPCRSQRTRPMGTAHLALQGLRARTRMRVLLPVLWMMIWDMLSRQELSNLGR